MSKANFGRHVGSVEAFYLCLFMVKLERYIFWGLASTIVSRPFTIIAEYDFDDSDVKARPLELVPPTLVTKMPMPKKFYRDRTK